jgi:hypothetical protein
MSFAVVLEPEAEDDLRKLPELVRGRVAEELNVLANQPSRTSTPARAPYPPGQLYRAEFRAGDLTALLDVVFLYGQDEASIHVMRVYVEYR